MKVLSLFTTTTVILSTIGISSAADEKYVYGKDPKKDAEYDISMGMAGIQQASKDPKLLAQLMQDMQVSFEWIEYMCCWDVNACIEVWFRHIYIISAMIRNLSVTYVEWLAR